MLMLRHVTLHYVRVENQHNTRKCSTHLVRRLFVTVTMQF